MLSNMLLRTTLSNTKKFFQKTVENFKSFLSGGYQRLPNSSPCNSFPCGCSGGDGSVLRDRKSQVKYSQSYKELGKLSLYFDHDPGRMTRMKETPTTAIELSRRKDDGEGRRRDDHQDNHVERKENSIKEKKIVYEGKRHFHQDSSRSNKILQRERTFSVAKKLKELEMFDNGNAEHVLDIEEVLHYYSRLTCPAYVDIVDTFFLDMYSELFNGQESITASSHFHDSRRPMLRMVGFHH